MASSVLKRCVAAAVKVKRLSSSLSARRCLLSASYTDTKIWDAREKDPQNLAVLASLMDRTYERKLPVSSLTISRFVDNISSREEVDQAEYYLYKFRHSPNCWFLRDWTIHSWIRKCIKYGARDKALYTLKNKVQFGIFPDDFTFNILLDSFIKDGDFKSACSVVEEVMFQEAFDLSSTQILSLVALSNYLSSTPQLTVSEEKLLGASLFHCGIKQENSVGLSAQLLGNALLGKVELLKGIHAVFKGMPLLWTRGYMGRALDIMERVAAAPDDIKLTKDTLDSVSSLFQDLSSVSDTDSSGGEESAEEEVKKDDTTDEDDVAEQARLPHYAERFKDLVGQLESRSKVEAASFQTLVSALAEQNLAAAEKVDLEQYESRVQVWEAGKRQLVQKEQENRLQAEQERQNRLAAKAAAQQA